MSFYMYLSSKDSEKLFEHNQFHDFIVETDREYDFSGCGEWSVALVDFYLEGYKTGRAEKLVKSIIILCDLGTDSYILGRSAPVLRYIPATEEVGTSLFQPHYIGVSKARTNRIRIYLRDKSFNDLTTIDWPEDLVFRCTLHFVKHE